MGKPTISAKEIGKTMTSNVAIPVDQCLDQHASEKLLAGYGN